MNQSEFLAITYNVLKEREIWGLQAAIGFGFIRYKTGVRFLSQSLRVAINFCVRANVVWKP